MASPVQIILNPESYEEAREAGGGGGRKDFFAHKDREFLAHHTALISQLGTIAGASVHVVDANSLLDNAIADPAAYGLTNVTSPGRQGKRSCPERAESCSGRRRAAGGWLLSWSAGVDGRG